MGQAVIRYKLVSRCLFARNFGLDAFATFTIQQLLLLSLTTILHTLLFESCHRDR